MTFGERAQLRGMRPSVFLCRLMLRQHICTELKEGGASSDHQCLSQLSDFNPFLSSFKTVSLSGHSIDFGVIHKRQNMYDNLIQNLSSPPSYCLTALVYTQYLRLQHSIFHIFTAPKL